MKNMLINQELEEEIEEYDEEDDSIKNIAKNCLLGGIAMLAASAVLNVINQSDIRLISILLVISFGIACLSIFLAIVSFLWYNSKQIEKRKLEAIKKHNQF